VRFLYIAALSATVPELKLNLMQAPTRAKIANALLEMNFLLSEASINILCYALQSAYAENIERPGEPPMLILPRIKLIEVANLGKNGGRLSQYLDELQREIFKSDTPEITISAPIISAYIWHQETDMISLEFSRLLWEVWHDVIKNYTVFDLYILWQINGKYCKRFYLDVMRWSNRGQMKLSIDNLRARYETEYTYNDIMRRIILPGISQIQQLTNIRVNELAHTKRGKKVETLNFHINKPETAALEPMAEKLTMRYGVNESYARLIVNTLSFRDIRAVMDTIDKKRGKIQNIGAYTATIFASYGISNNAKKA
jgi:hypothetical protein